MENLEEKLIKVAKEQMYLSFYDVHLQSPLFAPASPPSHVKEDKKSDSFTVRLPSWVRDELSAISTQEDISMSQLIANAIINSILKHHDQQEARQIFLELMLKWKDEPAQIEPMRMSDIHRMSNTTNPLRERLSKKEES